MRFKIYLRGAGEGGDEVRGAGEGGDEVRGAREGGGEVRGAREDGDEVRGAGEGGGPRSVALQKMRTRSLRPPDLFREKNLNVTPLESKLFS